MAAVDLAVVVAVAAAVIDGGDHGHERERGHARDHGHERERERDHEVS